MPPLTIGLTGGIGSGKSTVANCLKDLGAEVVSGDDLGRTAVEAAPEILAAIRKRFGGDVFDNYGKLQRAALGKRVFSSSEHVQWLTALTFPVIHHIWQEKVLTSTIDAIVLDAALIFEWGIENEFDMLIVVASPRQQVIDRALLGGRFSAAEIEERLKQQWPPEHKAARADTVLDNNSSISQLHSLTTDVWNSQIIPKINQTKL